MIKIEEINKRLFITFFSENSIPTLDEKSLKEIQETLLKKTYSSLIFSSEKNHFLGGMNVHELKNFTETARALEGSRLGQDLFNLIENFPGPTLCFVEGFCLGGGFELAMACKYIYATSSALFGLPEVKLGILPGFGGTYRLKKLVGLQQALTYVLTGKIFSAEEALKKGIITGITEKKDFFTRIDFYESFIQKKKKISFFNNLSFYQEFILKKATENVFQTTKGLLLGPLKILTLFSKTRGERIERHLLLESELFSQLASSSQSKYLQSVFLKTEVLKKLYETIKPFEGTFSVVGTGTMGSSIAHFLRLSSQLVFFIDKSLDALKKGLNSLEFQVKNPSKFFQGIFPTINFNHQSSLYIEAIQENFEVKKEFFISLEKAVSKTTILTTNTSSLSVQLLANALQHPERFLGLHFFNPAHKMPLVEIILHDKADLNLAHSLYRFFLKNKKIPIILKDTPGFLVNRLLMSLFKEVFLAIEEGISGKSIEDSLLAFGFPMGPLRLMDEIGLDVLQSIIFSFQKTLHLNSPSLLNTLVEKKFFGKKSNNGFYTYTKSSYAPAYRSYIFKPATTHLKNSLFGNTIVNSSILSKRFLSKMKTEAIQLLKDQEGFLTEDIIHLGLIYGAAYPAYQPSLFDLKDL